MKIKIKLTEVYKFFKHSINIKPLSVNQCWQGRRFKTKIYEKYEKQVLELLKTYKIKLEKTKKYGINITFYISNKLSDVDNFVKPFLDILQKKYNFNDKQIFELNLKKVIIPKKETEKIEFQFFEIS